MKSTPIKLQTVSAILTVPFPPPQFIIKLNKIMLKHTDVEGNIPILFCEVFAEMIRSLL